MLTIAGNLLRNSEYVRNHEGPCTAVRRHWRVLIITNSSEHLLSWV